MRGDETCGYLGVVERACDETAAVEVEDGGELPCLRAGQRAIQTRLHRIHVSRNHELLHAHAIRRRVRRLGGLAGSVISSVHGGVLSGSTGRCLWKAAFWVLPFRR